jgi:hypothetical protein
MAKFVVHLGFSVSEYKALTAGERNAILYELKASKRR